MTTRRASLPGADELFRRTTDVEPKKDGLDQAESASGSVVKSTNLQVAQEPAQEAKKPRHDEKVTFYCTGSDLTRLERARLALRAEFGLASDRGRIVRAALGELLDDFEARGPSSALVRRLQQGQV